MLAELQAVPVRSRQVSTDGAPDLGDQVVGPVQFLQRKGSEDGDGATGRSIIRIDTRILRVSLDFAVARGGVYHGR